MSEVEEAIKIVVEAGYQLDAEALFLLKEIEEPREVVKEVIRKVEALPEKPLVLSVDLFREVIFPSTEERLEEIITGKELFIPYAKEVEPEVQILKDPTPNLGSRGEESDFLQYFRDRFDRLKKILKRRLDVRGTVSIDEALKVRTGESIKFVGMVVEKLERKNQILIELDDLKGSATVIVVATNPIAFEKARSLLLDEVVCMHVIRGRGDRFVAIDIIRPDVERRKGNRSEVPIYAILSSDLHIGSRKFLRKTFDRFIKWLNGKVGSERERDIAGRVKYLVIAGDLTDGTGVYPGQEEELEIANIYEQYKVAFEYLQKIPDYIQTVIIPGNHDATRQALPQPAILRKYAKEAYSDSRNIMIGNPAFISLHGVRFLVFHGKSLEDVIGSVQGLTYFQPEEAMKVLLQARHIAPVYGKETPISPETRDYLVIEETPDVLHAGHIHVNGYCRHAGVLIVNSGTWQATTEYQRRMGIVPTPGLLPVVNLQDLEVVELNFVSPSLISRIIR